MNKLQNIILPNIDSVSVPLSNYFHGDFVIYRNSNNQKQITLNKFSTIQSNTYFNSFSLDFWQQKTEVEQLNLCLYGQGIAQLNIKLDSTFFATKIIFSSTVKLTDEGITIPIGNLRNFSTTGIIYFELTALSNHLTLYNGAFITSSIPKRDINLGIVITHYNRKKILLPAIKRLNQYLENNPDYLQKISIIIIDNSKNINPQEIKRATVIPSNNLGGSGGFTRGLIYLQENNKYSHCLFMDDDICCEVESIIRSFHACQFSKKDISIYGTLLEEDYPDIIYERGAFFSSAKVKSLYRHLQVNNSNAVLWSEKNEQQVNYGAWWFFLFPLKQVKYLPYPFFIRGDDILFSLQNRFELTTFNGIACWGENFLRKENALIRYLSFRGAAICSLFHDKNALFAICTLFLKQIIKLLFSYHYASAKAVLQSMEDLQKKSNFIKENIDLSIVRSELNQMAINELPTKIERDIYNINYPQKNQNTATKLLKLSLSIVTFNGHLLPDFLLQNKKVIIYQSRGKRINFSEIFRYQRILYMNETTDQGYILTINRSSFFKIFTTAIKLTFKFILNYKELQGNYRNSCIAFTSLNFWEKQYDKE